MDLIFMAFPPPTAQHIFKNMKTEITMSRIQPKTLISQNMEMWSYTIIRTPYIRQLEKQSAQ